jgi:hypothetical protein
MVTADPSAKPRSARLAGNVLFTAAIVAVMAGAGIATAGILRNPTLEGILGGVFGGLLLALVIMAIGAWAAMSLMRTPKPADVAGGDALAAQLKDVLDELEEARLEMMETVNRRAVWCVPLAVAAGVALLVFQQFSDEPPEVFAMIVTLGVSGAVGYGFASLPVSMKYRQLYKDKVLPRLAASFGDLSYRKAHMPDLARLKAECIFRKFDASAADDELFGSYRTLPLSIVELTLTEGSGKSRRTTFDGLLVTLELPRDTGAVTAVVVDAGGLGNFIDRQKGQHRERVRLEDPRFEKVYEVYGTDQVASRALLHPAFMEKLLALGDLADFERPQMLCDGKVMQIAMPKRGNKNLFEPPSFSKPAATRERLVELQNDIVSVLDVADALIDLDHRFEVRSATTPA